MIFYRLLIALALSTSLFTGCSKHPSSAANTNALTFTNNQNIKITYKNEEDAEYMSRDFALTKLLNSGAPDALGKFVEGARILTKDYPNRLNGYFDLMAAINTYESNNKPDQARALAQELIEGSAPDNFKQWAKGFLYRLDSSGKPVEIKFTAVDGRDVDLSQMNGKVVLVYFWEGRELPQVRAAWEKFHAQGFEVIGISCDTGKTEFEEYFKQNKMLWPQYSEGKQQNDNKFTVQFGIDGIPHLFLVDQNGCLRFDNVDWRAGYGFESKIATLLAGK
jgi:peroxiredoxin